MLVLTLPGMHRGLAQISAPVVRKVQQAQRESQAAIRFSQRLYRFYKLSEEGRTSLRASN
jgi:hypothetical protein